MRGFDFIDSGLCRMKGFKTHHGIGDFLDETVILFNQVIQLFNLKYFNKTDQICEHQIERGKINFNTSFFHNVFKITIRNNPA